MCDGGREDALIYDIGRCKVRVLARTLELYRKEVPMKLELDIKRLRKEVKRTRNSLKDLEEQNKKLTQKFVKEAKENLSYIASTAIDKFYEDYEPHFYSRTYDLYNTYRIKVDENEWSIDFDSSWMENWHRVDAQDPEYIFENSFIHGWHGGAISGEGHPNPGVPHWRIPDVIVTDGEGLRAVFSDQSRWVPSLMSPSPYKEIVRKSNLYMKLETEKYHAMYNQNVEKFQRQMSRNLGRIR